MEKELIEIIEEEMKLGLIQHLADLIEQKKYKGTKKEREGIYYSPDFLNVLDVLESKNLPFGYHGKDSDGAVYSLDYFEGRKSAMLKVTAKNGAPGPGPQWDLKEFLEEDPSRLNIRWVSNNIKSLKLINDEYVADHANNSWYGEVVLTDNEEIAIVEKVSSVYTYWGQEVELPRIARILETKSLNNKI